MLTDLSSAAPDATGDSTHGSAQSRHRFRLRWHHPSRSDLIACAIYVCAAAWVNYRLLRHPRVRLQATNMADDANFQWMLAHAARVLSHGVNPFFTYQMNVPDGVNLMANTALLGLTLPLAPVTLLLGTGVSYALLVMFALAGTAAAWYYVLSRHVVTSRPAALLGGLFAGFAPAMVSQVNGHPNIAAQFLVPFLIWRSFKLREPGRAVRNGVVLGLLVVWQVFLNEEILLMTALFIGLFVGCYALFNRGPVPARGALIGADVTQRRRTLVGAETMARQGVLTGASTPLIDGDATPKRRTRIGGEALAGVLRPGLRGLAVTALVAGVLLAYPLYWQFAGPQSYLGLPMTIQKNFGADVTSFTAFASQSVGGSKYTLEHFAQNASEENSFFGWPLAVLLVVLVWWLRRGPAVRAMVVVGVVAGVLSLGPRLYIYGHHTRIPAPYALLNHLPLFDTVVPTRFALVLTPLVGVLLALGYQRMSDLRRTVAVPVEMPVRLVAGALLAAALLPLVPRPLPAAGTLSTPAFVTSGQWRGYVPPGQSLVTVPTTSSKDVQGMLWSASTGLDLPLQAGYFLGPSGSAPEPRRAAYGPPKRPTPVLWDRVAATGKVPAITSRQRADAVADLRYWRAAAVTLQPGTRHAKALRTTTIRLLDAQPKLVGGVWLWDVRAMDRPPTRPGR